MTAQELLLVLKSDRETKQRVFDEMISRLTQGESLQDHEISPFEALKQELTRQSVVVQMEASLTGMSNVKSE